MQTSFTTFLAIAFLALPLLTQAQDGTIYDHDRVISRGNPLTFNPEWAPFYHGVASGDPLEDRVIIWTRVTPAEMSETPIEVNWQVATDPQLENVVQTGIFNTDSERDYTVKIDVTGLEPGTTYYYSFFALGKNSLTGKTKTTAVGDAVNHLRFGVVSCSNFEAGYFNAYRRLAERNDLDAVIHLGDYIYEQAARQYGDSTLWNEARTIEPENEIVSMEEYRTRYSTYRLDTNLVRAHQQHPFIAVWDDHESANDAWEDGAQAHQPDLEGDWGIRKAVAKQVYFEWMPIRDTENQSVYRSIRYGDLMDLIMLDTRLEGREQQVAFVGDSTLFDPSRTLLGAEQKAWLFNELSTSEAQWKVIGQQIIFSELNVGWAALQDQSLSYEEFESVFLDIWDGYPAERAEVIGYIDSNAIDNVVILSGDFHSTFAFDVTAQPIELTFQEIPGVGQVPFFGASPTYDAATGKGAAGVEFVTPSITSANFDENVGALAAAGFQAQINQPIENIVNLGNPNPHMKFVDLIQHGYFILDVKPDSVQANWYFTDIDRLVQEESFAGAWYTQRDSNHLQIATMQSASKVMQDEPAPDNPPLVTAVEEVGNPQLAILGVYPNPFEESNTLHYSLAKEADVLIELHDVEGRVMKTLVNQNMRPGIYTVEMQSDDLAEGLYMYKIQIAKEVHTAKVILKR